jgi:cell division protein FtsB
MSETSDKSRTEAERKDQPKQQTTQQGTAEKSTLEKAADTVAGDNKLMDMVMKVLLSPLALFAGVGALIYCFLKIRGLNEEVKRLEVENKKLSAEKTFTDEEYQRLKRKHKKLKALNESEAENSLKGLGYMPPKQLPADNKRKNTYHSAYLP